MQYIIRQGTIESRLLGRIGFNREDLRVAKWKGRRQSRGGFGRSPIAWYIDGEEEIKTYLNNISRLLSRKGSTKLSIEEKNLFTKVKKAIGRLNRKSKIKLSSLEASKLRKEKIVNLLRIRYPCLEDSELAEVSELLSFKTYDSINELLAAANRRMDNRLEKWEEVRKEFLRILRIY